jgi:hypothetical protein
MTISFVGFDLGSYLIGLATPFVIAIVIATVKFVRDQRRR